MQLSARAYATTTGRHRSLTAYFDMRHVPHHVAKEGKVRSISEEATVTIGRHVTWYVLYCGVAGVLRTTKIEKAPMRAFYSGSLNATVFLMVLRFQRSHVSV